MLSAYRKIPAIVRARDFHLFDVKGRRYLDLWQNGGRALLGHRPENVYRDMKIQLQKGAVAEAPSVYEPRLLRLLQTLIPGSRAVVLCRSLERALMMAAEYSGRTFSETGIAEPFFPSSSPAVYHRPFSGCSYGGFPFVFPVLPFPGGFAPQPVIFMETAGPVPEGDLVSPMLLSGLLRSLHDLLKAGNQPGIWNDWQMPGWKRYSCYCFPDFPLERYEAVFDVFLSKGILLSPDPRSPTVLPLRFSEGEKKAVERLCAETARGGSHGV